MGVSTSGSSFHKAFFCGVCLLSFCKWWICTFIFQLFSAFSLGEIGINNESTDLPIEQSGDKGAQSVVDGGSVGHTVAPIVTRRRASLNLSQQENVPQDADHAQGAIRQNIGAQKQPKKHKKRANTTGPSDDDDFVDGAPRRDSDLNVVARDANKRKIAAPIQAKGRVKRAKISRLPESEDANQTQIERCQETTMRDGNGRVQRNVNGEGGTHSLEDTRAETDDAFPTVHTRTSPAIFVKAVFGLSEDQKRAVRELGFGCLLDLTITATPEDDVYSVLGLPRGTIEVTNRKKKTESGALKEWADMYNVSIATKITATKVLEMIQTCDRSDDWFKRHFVVLVVTCLFESSQNGVANLRTVHLLDDLSNVSKMNWCAYMIRCLVGAKKSWNANQKRKNFTGPLLFLTVSAFDH
ncbi:Unknown protein [Striga hermonthica]|uniref:Aminotransferase-like plant mobile domain-containing protein n=1 Tax=Striga hermonthica TaxID=68872 RepID=A0A9N7P2Y2_STRHE|nr:Unknown protein [Striga hermonthica]